MGEKRPLSKKVALGRKRRVHVRHLVSGGSGSATVAKLESRRQKVNFDGKIQKVTLYSVSVRGL